LSCGHFYGFGSNEGHAPVIRRASTQKAWAAVWFFLDDAASRRYRGGAKWIGRSKDGHDGQTDRRGNVHRARIVPNKEMALRKKGW